MSMKNSALMVPRGGGEVQDLLYEDCINDDAGDGAEDIGHGLGVEDGAPPTPTRKAKAPSMVTTGPQTPTPARAVSPVSGMLLMYILSTML